MILPRSPSDYFLSEKLLLGLFPFGCHETVVISPLDLCDHSIRFIDKDLALHVVLLCIKAPIPSFYFAASSCAHISSLVNITTAVSVETLTMVVDEEALAQDETGINGITLELNGDL